MPRGAHPSYAHDYSVRHNDFYRAWDAISRDRDPFTQWIDTHIRQTSDFSEYLAMVDRELVGAR